MTKICVAYGDGIGPEIMTSVIAILKAAKVEVEYDVVEVGEKVYLNGISNGISDDAWNKILQNKILLKGPMTTPLGGGYKSINVTLRKKLGLFANVRPVVSYSPFIKCNAQNMDVVIVRENEEDLYSGIEYQTTENSYVAVKLISESGSRKIIKYAFDYAVSNGRKKVTCITKNNIMKLSDGVFARIFDEVAKDYPQIENNHMIVDIGSARIASKPESFDVIVTLNLYGDIISDIAAEAAGAVGIAGSANIGGDYAMFEAVHGSAPDISGQGKANPSGLLSAAIMMLRHLKMHEKANLVENAWLATIEDGVHTADLYSGTGKLVSTTAFTEEVIKRIGTKPKTLKASEKQAGEVLNKLIQTPHKNHKVVGCDVYIRSANTKDFHNIQNLQTDNLRLTFIGYKGLVIWPGSSKDAELDMLQLRFISTSEISQNEIIKLQQLINNANLEIVMLNTLSEYDGKQGFSKGQGE